MQWRSVFSPVFAGVLAAGCASAPLQYQATWRRLPAPAVPSPRAVRSLPHLSNLSQSTTAIVQALREHCLELNFVTYPNGDVPAAPGTAWVGFSDTHFLAVIEGRKGPDYALTAHRQGKENPHIWYDDNFEVFVDPFLSRSDYVHFIVNPLGDVYDARCRIRQVPDPKAADGTEMMAVVRSDMSYTSGAAVSVVRTRTRWTVLFRLPFSAFGLGSAPVGQIWGFNFCRTNRENGELTQWCPTPGDRGFHQPGKFGALRFGLAREQCDVRFAIPFFGFGRNAVAVTFANPSAAAVHLEWRVRLTDATAAGTVLDEHSGGFRLEAGGRRTQRLPFAVPFQFRGQCRVTVEVTADSTPVGCFVRYFTLGAPLAWALPLTQIYTTDPYIEANLRVALGEEELNGGDTPLTVRLTGPAGARRERFVRLRGNLLSLRLSTRGLTPGRYTLRADYGGRAACTQRFDVVPAPFDF
ncbi:MAG: hypothetical protein GXP31_05050 [Kiritimatiellaeota bacterium]|nr:hypothetical protein [Kiritimatiellota bacterium]